MIYEKGRYSEQDSQLALQDFYRDVPPPHRLSGSSYIIPSEFGSPPASRSTTPMQQYQSSSFPPTANFASSGPYAHQPVPTYSTPDLNMTSYPARAGSPNAEYQQYAFGGQVQAFEPRKSNKKKWIIIGSVVAVIGAVIIAVVVAVVVSHNKNSSSSRSSSSSSSSSSSGSSSSGSSSSGSSSGDPSNFAKNNLLHPSFYGIAYTPEGSQLPDCGNKLEDVITDMQLLSQLTTRIRLYGADCNQSALVLEAIKQTKVNMTVFLGNYPVATDNNTAYARQRDEIKAALQTYGTDHIGGITVGNEFILNYLTDNGGNDPNTPLGDQGAALIIADIEDTRQMLSDMGLNIKVGNADAGSFFNTKVLQSIDYGMANVHPWFANVSAADGAGWTADFFQQTDVAAATVLSNNPTMSIAETGWPTDSSDVGNESNGPSTASEANLQIFLDTFVCQANANGTGYFFFEYFDEPWKDAQFGGVEGWWGLFHANRTLKNINIPNCPLS